MKGVGEFNYSIDTECDRPKVKNGNIIGVEGVARVVQVGRPVAKAVNGNISVGDWFAKLYGYGPINFIRDRGNFEQAFDF
ncbi:hypothetical protein AYI69_g7628 [Smittium culicis]|uniref:Uncharacterized protein n=1 Tax=Smittium culicis TaxID=133412 RepID=A0A1R1XQQ5_9FUNG|nr:hypothetical protein AYI69_g7628 [Smittium culicis]